MRVESVESVESEAVETPEHLPRKKRKSTKTKALEASVRRHFARMYAERISKAYNDLNEVRSETRAKALQVLRRVEDDLRPAITKAEQELRVLLATLGATDKRVDLVVLVKLGSAATPVALGSGSPLCRMIVEEAGAVKELRTRLRLLEAERDRACSDILDELAALRSTKDRRAVLKKRGISEELRESAG
ncbi:MAG: hypothetical protein ACPLRM_08860 [Anaerolineae bacterium]